MAKTSQIGKRHNITDFKSSKKNPLRHIIIKLLKTKDKETIWKQLEKKYMLQKKGTIIETTVDFLSEAMEAK